MNTDVGRIGDPTWSWKPRSGRQRPPRPEAAASPHPPLDAAASHAASTWRLLTTGPSAHTRTAPAVLTLHSPPTERRSVWLTFLSSAFSARTFLRALVCKLIIFTNCMHRVGAVFELAIMERCCWRAHGYPMNAAGGDRNGNHEHTRPKGVEWKGKQRANGTQCVPEGPAAHEQAPVGGGHQPLNANLHARAPGRKG